MEIRVLGTHNLESAESRLVSILIDGILAIDAGSLTSALSFEEQEKVRSILLTHSHFDHVRDVATIALSTYALGTIDIYSTEEILKAISAHILNGVIYADFTKLPSLEAPSVRYHPLKPLTLEEVNGYTVFAVPVNHKNPSFGYQVTSKEGKSLFYSGDTGPGCSAAWEQISPDLLIIETTLSNAYEEMALAAGHLTPNLLSKELEDFRRIKGYLPPIVVIHTSPQLVGDIGAELGEIARELEASITVGHDGMRLRL